jgi:hypothetical protein
VLVPALAIFAALALLGWARRFSRRDGLWMRRRQRRRWRVGLRAYRLAQTLGFGYSHSRDALVPKVGNGAFGPVLRLRRSDVASHRPPGTLDGRSARTTHRPAASPFPHPAPELPTSTRSRSTVDVACLPFPHADRDAGLWQLTAVELGSRFVWAELVGPHVERPAAQELAAFVRRVAADLWGADQLLGTLVVHAAPPGLFDRGLLPTGVRLLALARNTTRTQVAAEIHDQLAERDGYSRLAADASFAELSRWLQSRVAALNATNGAEPTVLGHAR